MDGPGNAASDIHFWAHRHAGLADLQVVVADPGIHSRTASTHFGMKLVRLFIEHAEAFLAAHAVTAADAYNIQFGIEQSSLHILQQRFACAARLFGTLHNRNAFAGLG